MEFSGLEPADFANVQSLNDAFLNYLRGPGSGQHLRQQLPAATEQMLAGLTDLQIRRLAKAPFLLFSLHEGDDDYWAGKLAHDRNRDLFATTAVESNARAQLISAALGFLWELARRNPYALRVVSGATLNWSEHLAEQTLLRLLQRVADQDDLLLLRHADNGGFWRKLLVAGVSSERNVRIAAQLCALQMMLTDGQRVAYRRLPAAACRVPVPSLQLAEHSDSVRRRKKL